MSEREHLDARTYPELDGPEPTVWISCFMDDKPSVGNKIWHNGEQFEISDVKFLGGQGYYEVSGRLTRKPDADAALPTDDRP